MSSHLRFDFDGDNYISPDEVFLLLSYIPFKRPINGAASQGTERVSGDAASSTNGGESLPNRETANASTMNEEERSLEQREIKSFVQQAFQEVPRFPIDQYLEFNSSISSEMFVSVMSIIQERLPCSSFYFRQRR